MKCKSLVAMILLAGSVPALAADQNIASVQVTAKPVFALEFSCASPTTPSRADVEKILNINDGSQTRALGNKLMEAVGEACNASVANIEVRRGAHGRSLTWTAVREQARSVAAN